MQILGKRSKKLLIAVAIVMLVAVGISFAAWDSMLAVKANNGDLSYYANAKVGDVIEFGRYYQTGIKDETTGEYEKTPIEWIVVDKDERTGQLTLMSKYILAAGSYFGNWYYNKAGIGDWHYKSDKIEVGSVSTNQAYVESTVRAFLNNLERRDLGGDSYLIESGYKTSVISSTTNKKLLASVGFSNMRYSINGISFQRPINNIEYKNRPATRGFYDEAFTTDEKNKIVPKAIPGYIGYRWPNNTQNAMDMSYVEGAIDKIWIPSVAELNIMNIEDDSTNPSDEASSTVFEYFKDKAGVALQNALKSTRTTFVIKNSMAMNYSIPVYKYQSIEINEDINEKTNSLDYYWTRSPMSHYFNVVRYVLNTGEFNTMYSTDNSHFGVRPCVILKY